MGRPRIMLDVRIFHNAKFGSLSNRGKLGWIYLLCEAKQQDREGLFPSRPVFLLGAGPFRDRLSEWLGVGLIHQGTALCPKCTETYGSVADDAIVVHDWSDYQISRTSVWREENGLGKDGKKPGNNGETPGETPVKPLRVRVRDSASVSVSSSGTTEGGAGETDDPADAYWTLVGRYPTDRVRDWLDDLASKYGAEPVIRHLALRFAEDQKLGTLMGRVTDNLKAEARALDRAEQEAERARLREKRAIPKVVPAWDQEYRAALEAKYGASA